MLKIKGNLGVGAHATVTVSHGDTSVVVCGDSWCNGACGYPAMAWRGLKLHGPMVAHGPAWQRFRVPWKGAIVEHPEPDAETMNRMWW